MTATLSAVEGISAVLLHYSQQEQIPPELQGTIAEPEFPESISDPYQLYRIRPGVRTPHYATDSRGLRGDEFEPREGQLRVLLLGGSVAWSYLARSNQETLAAALSRYLSRALQDGRLPGWSSATVLNAGVPAYVSRQAAVYYARSLRSLRAHIVVSLDGVNDISAALTYWPGAPLFWSEAEDPFERHPEALSRSLPAWLQYRWLRSKFNRLRLRWNPAPLESVTSVAPREVADSYFETLHYLATLTARDGAAFIPVLQPVCVFDQEKALTPFEERLARSHDRDLPGRNGFFHASYAEMAKALQRISRDFPHASPLDGRGAFHDERDHCFADCYHLAPQGIEHLAKMLGERLLRAGGPIPSE